jgi:hypothetical protein
MVHRLSGYQGTLSTVTATGYQATLVNIVANAWVDIQNLRSEWDFLKDNVTLATTIGKSEYTISDIFTTLESNVGKYRGILGPDQERLRHITHDRYVLDDISNEDSGTIVKYAVHPTTQSLWFNPPDTSTNLDIHYWKKPQVLSVNTDVPLCPTEFHYAIVYQALVDLGIFMGNSDLYTGYGVKASSLVGDLLRHQNPSKSIKTRPLV